jgi:protein tyrosine/serine phosphatase
MTIVLGAQIGIARLQMEWNATSTQRIALSLIISAFVTSVAFFSSGFLTGNVHVVAEGELYRSAQLNTSQLRQNLKRFHIASVINLRGENPNQDWYVAELDLTQRLNVQHFDFRMSAKENFSRDDAAKLIALMAKVPKPALIHCGAGADRTSLAAALYLAAIKKSGHDAAEAQLHFMYGHIALPFLKTNAIDDSWERLEAWLGFSES